MFVHSLPPALRAMVKQITPKEVDLLEKHLMDSLLLEAAESPGVDRAAKLNQLLNQTEGVIYVVRKLREYVGFEQQPGGQPGASQDT